MPLARNSIQNALSVHTVASCLEIVRSSLKKVKRTVKPIGMNCSQPSALLVDSQLKLVTDGWKL